MLKMQAVLLDIPNISEQQWQDFLAARAEAYAEYLPGESVPSHFKDEQRQFLSKIPELRDTVVFWLLYNGDGDPVGYCSAAHPKPESPDYEANKDRIYVEPVVLAPYRRQGVATQLLPFIVEYAQKVGVTWVESDTKFESGFRFSEKIGAIEAGRQRTNRLAVDQVDWEMLERWAEEGRNRNPGVELVRIVNLPAPGSLGPLCDLVTDINLLQPKDDIEGISFTCTPEEFLRRAAQNAEQKIERVILYTREPDGMLSGLTDMFYEEANPSRSWIGLTGVRREFQNCGRGKWLKAAMMLDLREHHPEIRLVDTSNFNSNDPMLSINDRMGFKLFEQYVFYKVRVEDLAAKLNSILVR